MNPAEPLPQFLKRIHGSRIRRMSEMESHCRITPDASSRDSQRAEKDGDMHAALVTFCLFMQYESPPLRQFDAPPVRHSEPSPPGMMSHPPLGGAAVTGGNPVPYSLPSGHHSTTCRCPTCGHRVAPKRHCLQPTGDLVSHSPYEARPKTYYYFRPYNPAHVEQQAGEAGTLALIPRAPHSNSQFQKVYESVEAQFDTRSLSEIDLPLELEIYDRGDSDFSD